MGYRLERDSLGEKQIPEDAYYGLQTLRGSSRSRT
jgi:aspartate ammonia-lyase